MNDIALVGAGIILEDRISPIHGLRIWNDGMKPRRWNQKTNQEELYLGRRDPTQSWNMWLSSKPQHHLQLQLLRTLKGINNLAHDCLKVIFSEVFISISYMGCNYSAVVSAMRLQLEYCFWA